MTLAQASRPLIITGVLAAGVAGCWLAGIVGSPSNEAAGRAAQKAPKLPPPSEVQTTPDEVFRKAFWREPTASDRILHAERREWREPDPRGKEMVRRIAWFISVEPSADLVKYLRADNAFRLVPAKTPPEIADAPDWFAFKPADVDVLESPFGHMKLIFSRSSHRLYATDMALGFRPGAPYPVKPPPSDTAISKGPLPNSHPPRPQS